MNTQQGWLKENVENVKFTIISDLLFINKSENPKKRPDKSHLRNVSISNSYKEGFK